MNDRERRYDAWVARTPLDDEDDYRKREAREESRAEREEYMADCRKDNELTNPKEEVVCEPELDWRTPLTPDQEEELAWQRYKKHDEDYHFNREKIWMEGY